MINLQPENWDWGQHWALPVFEASESFLDVPGNITGYKQSWDHTETSHLSRYKYKYYSLLHFSLAFINIDVSRISKTLIKGVALRIFWRSEVRAEDIRRVEKFSTLRGEFCFHLQAANTFCSKARGDESIIIQSFQNVRIFRGFVSKEQSRK